MVRKSVLILILVCSFLIPQRFVAASVFPGPLNNFLLFLQYVAPYLVSAVTPIWATPIVCGPGTIAWQYVYPGVGFAFSPCFSVLNPIPGGYWPYNPARPISTTPTISGGYVGPRPATPTPNPNDFFYLQPGIPSLGTVCVSGDERYDQLESLQVCLSRVQRDFTTCLSSNDPLVCDASYQDQLINRCLWNFDECRYARLRIPIPAPGSILYNNDTDLLVGAIDAYQSRLRESRREAFVARIQTAYTEIVTPIVDENVLRGLLTAWIQAGNRGNDFTFFRIPYNLTNSIDNDVQNLNNYTRFGSVCSNGTSPVRSIAPQFYGGYALSEYQRGQLYRTCLSAAVDTSLPEGLSLEQRARETEQRVRTCESQYRNLLQRSILSYKRCTDFANGILNNSNFSGIDTTDDGSNTSEELDDTTLDDTVSDTTDSGQIIVARPDVFFIAANEVIDFSSEEKESIPQHLYTAGPAQQALGGTDGLWWRPLSTNRSEEFLTLGFPEELYAQGIKIDISGGGTSTAFITRIELLDTNGVYHPVDMVRRESLTPGVNHHLEATFSETIYRVKGVKIVINTDSTVYSQQGIDAVSLMGRRAPESQ